jgi:hypothetical protein
VLEPYLADWNAIDCGGVEPPICAAGCAEMMAVCQSGTCGALVPVVIDASQYDATCQSDEDCHMILTGNVCSACRCSAAAVNAGGFAQYQEDIEGVDCNPGPDVCDCATPSGVYCAKTEEEELGNCAVEGF